MLEVAAKVDWLPKRPGVPEVVRADPPKLSGAAAVEVVVVWDAPPKENPAPKDVVVVVIAAPALDPNFPKEKPPPDDEVFPNPPPSVKLVDGLAS